MNVGVNIFNSVPMFYLTWTSKLLFSKISLPHHQTHHSVAHIEIQNDTGNFPVSVHLELDFAL